MRRAVIAVSAFSMLLASAPADAAFRPEGPPANLAPSERAEWWLGAVGVMAQRCGHYGLGRDVARIARLGQHGRAGHGHWLSLLSPMACGDAEKVAAFILEREDGLRAEVAALNDCSTGSCVRRDAPPAATDNLDAVLDTIENNTSRWFGYDDCNADCL